MDRLSRRTLLTGAAGAAGSLAGCSGLSGGDTAGLRLDTLDVAGSSGSEVHVPASDGRTLIDFFATWCAPCKPQMAELRTVAASFPDVVFVSVTREDDTDAVRQFWRDYQGTWPVATDPDLRAFERFGVNRVPTKLVVDADGETAWRHSGLSSAETIADELRAAAR